jgi:hypothetical protein
MLDLLEQFGEFEAQEPPRTRTIGLGHPEQPPESVDVPELRDDE